ncbi:DMT family transporter [Extensimonas vulgaris]|uniref:Drug/metabolite transporter (DMT)-like permease n=1 Tax=Extensimonas vulgaris TaxID=1031594 RepID=A0A369AME1_9BURK|nr:DMT family transporter [Extensimonas vulgaris]RCX09488.1 drug/metabolite transporter (DMT)-like permease [Extensimonas vulgaris]TWI38618.1 drug/metabolite transporter (DMT)-like permease [Extensimonas vulgaris]TXD14528.1 DMT family transporter [Extensimonas vulgaris]
MPRVRITAPPTTPPAVSRLRFALVGTLFSLVWSSAFIAGKVGMAASGPLTLLSLRFLLAGLLVWPIARLRAGTSGGVQGAGAPGRPERAPKAQQLRDALVALLAGLLNNAVYLGLAFVGMRTVPAGLTTIVVSTSPLMTSALAALALRERLGWRAAAGLAAGFAGVVWIMRARALSGSADLHGVALILLGTVALSVSTLLYRKIAGRLDPWRIALIQLPASGLVLLPLAWWREGLVVLPSAAFFGSLLYLAVVVSIGTTLMLLWLVRHGGASRASSFHLLNPLFGTLLAVLLLGEHVPASDLLGALPIMAGLGLVLRPRRT